MVKPDTDLEKLWDEHRDVERSEFNSESYGWLEPFDGEDLRKIAEDLKIEEKEGDYSTFRLLEIDEENPAGNSIDVFWEKINMAGKQPDEEELGILYQNMYLGAKIITEHIEQERNVVSSGWYENSDRGNFMNIEIGKALLRYINDELREEAVIIDVDQDKVYRSAIRNPNLVGQLTPEKARERILDSRNSIVYEGANAFEYLAQEGQGTVEVPLISWDA